MLRSFLPQVQNGERSLSQERVNTRAGIGKFGEEIASVRSSDTPSEPTARPRAARRAFSPRCVVSPRLASFRRARLSD